MNIYTELLLDHARNPRNYKVLAKNTHQTSSANLSCGDSIVVYADIKNNVIIDISFTGKGCVISQAAASILLTWLKGKNKNDISSLTDSFIMKLMKIKLSPSRLMCARVVVEALQKLR